MQEGATSLYYMRAATTRVWRFLSSDPVNSLARMRSIRISMLWKITGPSTILVA